MIYHEGIHFGEQLYQCSIFGGSFTRRSDWITHEKIHTGEKHINALHVAKVLPEVVI